MSLRRADHTSRVVLLSVLCRCVWSINLKNKVTLVRVGPQHHRKKKKTLLMITKSPVSGWFVSNVSTLTNHFGHRRTRLSVSVRHYEIKCPYHFYSKTNQVHHCIKFILFWNEALHVSDGLSVHHQEFKILWCIYWFYYRNNIKMHGSMNVKFFHIIWQSHAFYGRDYFV